MRLFILLFLVSFSVSADTYYRVNGFVSSVPANHQFLGGDVSVGSTYKDFSFLIGKSYGGHTIKSVSSNVVNYRLEVRATNRRYGYIKVSKTSTCPEGTTLNEQTGKCEPPDFCSSSAWHNLVATESNACAARYPDFLTDFSSTCVNKDNYSFTCKQGVPKPPTGGDGSGGDGSGGDGSGGHGSGGDGSGGDGSGGDGSGGDGPGGDGSGGDGSGGDGSGGDGAGGDGSGGDGSGGDGSGGDGSGGDGSGGDGSGGDGSGGDGSGGGGSGGGGSGGGGSGGGGSGGGGSNENVVGAINNMNSNVNKALDELTLDINNIGSNIEGGLTSNTDAINSNGEKISGELSKGFGDLNGSLGGIKGSLDGLQGSLGGIQDSLDGLSNVDTNGAGSDSTCIGNSSCTGFYTSSYPKGLSGVMNGHFESIKGNVLDGFVDTFGKIDLSNAKQPSFAIPILDFGTFDITDYLNLDWIFGFVRFCLIYTAIATARKNILGG